MLLSATSMGAKKTMIAEADMAGNELLAEMNLVE